MKDKIWFRRKLYGWGWYPVTWEGWAVIFVWAFLFTSIMVNIERQVALRVLFIFISVLVLIYVCYKKGEKPKWQWGKREED